METDTPDFGALIDLLQMVVNDGLPHDRKKAIMLQLHAVKSYSRREHLADLTLNLLDIEDCLGFGKPETEIDNERLEALIGRLNNILFDDGDESEADAEAATESSVEEAVPVIEMTLCNCTSRDEAREIARGLVETGLAACVNIIANIGSIFRWQGEIVDTSECQLQIKSSPMNRERIKQYIVEHHSNDIPEIINVPISHGNVDYLAWVLENTEVEVN